MQPLQLKQGTPIVLEVIGRNLLLKPGRREQTLDELLEGVTPETIRHEADWGEPQGSEVGQAFPSEGRSSGQPSTLAVVMSRRGTVRHASYRISATTSLRGRLIACPITSQVKGYPLEVPLPAGLQTAGVVLAHQVKALDQRVREVRVVETAPPEFAEKLVEGVLDVLITLLEEDGV